MKRALIYSAILSTLCLSNLSFAEESTAEKIKTKTKETVDSTKEPGRDLSDEICELVNGKMKCVKKKIEHKVRTMKDKTETKTEKVIDKVD